VPFGHKVSVGMLDRGISVGIIIPRPPNPRWDQRNRVMQALYTSRPAEGIRPTAIERAASWRVLVDSLASLAAG